VNPPTFVIIADRITDDQRARLHEAIKQQAHNGWWHHYADVWIVRGQTAAFWRDQVAGFVGAGSAVLVLELSGDWASFGPTKYTEWLLKYLRP
jgi:hypothetical protein